MAGNLSEILARVDALKKEIDALRPINPEQEARLMQKLRLEWNYHSNALEGNKLTLGETRAFLLQGLTAQGKPFRDYLDIKGYNEAILLLEEFVRQERPLTEAAIRELHKIILVEPYHVDAVTFDGTPTRRLIEPGKYKTTPNHVLTSTGEVHYYASPEETPARMGELVAWYRRELEKGELHPLLLAATFHYEFAAIHPFDDGNGRMARLLMNLILMQTGFVPVVVQVDSKEEYLLALEKADTDDLEDFIVLMGRGLLRSMELYVRAARGERIEELGDLDKRVALLKMRLETEPYQPNPLQDVRIQQDLFIYLIQPLGKQLVAIAQRFAPLFKKFRLQITYGFENNFKHVLVKDVQDALDQLFSALGQRQIDSITLYYQLSELIGREKSGVLWALKFRLSDKYYRTTYQLQTHGSPQRANRTTSKTLGLEGDHHSLPEHTQEEIDKLASKLGDEIYQSIEWLANNSTPPQDPTTP